MFKKQRSMFVWIIILVIVSLSCSCPALSFLNPQGESQNQIPIPKDQDTTLGNVDGAPAAVSIPAGAFDENASAQISYPSALPADTDEGWTSLESAVNVELESGQTRSDQPMEVTLQFDSTGIMEPGEVFIGYFHNDYGWYFFAPDFVDLEQGTLTFTTYHFSGFSGMKADEEERIDQYLEKSAVETFVNQTTQAQSKEQIEAMVQKIMEEGVGVYDTHVIEIVQKAVVDAIPGGDIAMAIMEMKEDAIAKVVMETTVSEFGKIVSSDEKLLQDASDTSDSVGAFSAAAGYFAEGDYEEAARIMGNEIVDKTPLIGNVKKLADRVVELTDDVVTNLWYKPEIRKAFLVYKNGAEGGWFGYNVDAGDWPSLLSQMRGVFAKARSDYVQAYCNARGIDPGTLTSEEKNKIADQGMERLRAQFDEQIARRAEIDEIKDNQQKLFEAFAENQLLVRDRSNPMYAGNEDLETLMNRLLNFTQRVMQDTGRREIISHSFDEDIDRPGTQIYSQQIAELARTWYTTRKIEGPEQAEEAYKKALIEMGLMEEENLIHGVEPKKVTCEGQYTATFTRTEEPVKSCSYNMAFRLEFWNVGALGGAEYGGASFYWNYVSFDYDDCAITSTPEKTTTGQFSGGPNGSLTAGWANVQITSGQTGTLNYTDADEVVSGSCTINNPSAFAGWTGP
jgi:hypothetical protein